MSFTPQEQQAAQKAPHTLQGLGVILRGLLAGIRIQLKIYLNTDRLRDGGLATGEKSPTASI